MKIKFLGTAAAEGIPALYCQCDICKHAWENKGKNIRTRSQALIDDDLIIDFGPDTYSHVLKYEVPIDMIHHVLITHKHSDHFYPNDLLFRRPGYASKVDEGPLNVYGCEPSYEQVLKIEERENMSEYLKAHKITPLNSFNILDYKVTPLPAQHDERAGAVLYLLEKGNKSMFYAHDTGNFLKETWDYLANLEKPLDLISLDCTAMLRLGWDYGHLSFDCFMKVIDRLKEIKAIDEKTIIVANHFSHNGYATHQMMQDEADKYGVIVSYDGLEVEF